MSANNVFFTEKSTSATFKTLRQTVKELRVRDSVISRKFTLFMVTKGNKNVLVQLSK
jgi:hypothetical protein